MAQPNYCRIVGCVSPPSDKDDSAGKGITSGRSNLNKAGSNYMAQPELELMTPHVVVLLTNPK